MPQGLCNAVATFQRYMNWVLRDYIGKFCAVYIDDITIWSDTVEEHVEHVRLVLEKLREAGICASIKKSVLFADEIHFLGHIISSRGVEPAQTKVDKILAARAPSSPSDIKEFRPCQLHRSVPARSFGMVNGTLGSYSQRRQVRVAPGARRGLLQYQAVNEELPHLQAH